MLIAVAAAAFVLVNLDGADPGRGILGPNASAAQVAAIDHVLGVDRPWGSQFVGWVGGALRGDLGHSYNTGRPVADELGQRLPVTMSLVLCGSLLTAVLSLALALLAVSRGRGADRVVQMIAVTGQVVPAYLLALGLLAVAAIRFGVFPVFGYVPLGTSPSGWLSSIALPAVALALGGVAGCALQARGALIGVLTSDYIRTLRSRGIDPSSLLLRHGLRNAASPWLASLSLSFVAMLGGALMVEKVFAMPGLGTLAVDATTTGDRPVVMGLVALTAATVIMVNLITDVLQLWLIPRARTR
jgi:peptide/nickel transport system permease protein